MKLLILIGSAVLLLNTVLCLCCVRIASISDRREESAENQEDC